MAPPSLTRKLTETFCRSPRAPACPPRPIGGLRCRHLRRRPRLPALFASARAFSSRSLSRFALISAVCCCTFFTSVPGFALRDDFISRRSSSAELMVDSLPSVPTQGQTSTSSAPIESARDRLGRAAALPSAMIGRLATKDKDAPKPKPNLNKQSSTFAVKTQEQIDHEEKVRYRARSAFSEYPSCRLPLRGGRGRHRAALTATQSRRLAAISHLFALSPPRALALSSPSPSRARALVPQYRNEDNYNNPIAKKWCRVAKSFHLIVVGETFNNNFIIVCILIAGINVGLQSVPYYPKDECDTATRRTGSRPTSTRSMREEGAPARVVRTARRTTCRRREYTRAIPLSIIIDVTVTNFDFIIVAMCLPGVKVPGDPPVALLRLARLMRIAKIIKKVPQLQMIVMGLVGGIKSHRVHRILLFLVFYLYAIAGIMFFRENDPWHFGHLPTAMITLFRCGDARGLDRRHVHQHLRLRHLRRRHLQTSRARALALPRAATARVRLLRQGGARRTRACSSRRTLFFTFGAARELVAGCASSSAR